MSVVVVGDVGVNKTVRQNVDVVQENLMQCDPAKRVSESKAKPDEECIIYKEAPVVSLKIMWMVECSFGGGGL